MPCFQAKYELLLVLELRAFTLSAVELQFEAPLVGHFLGDHFIRIPSFKYGAHIWRPYHLSRVVKTGYLVLIYHLCIFRALSRHAHVVTLKQALICGGIIHVLYQKFTSETVQLLLECIFG